MNTIYMTLDQNDSTSNQGPNCIFFLKSWTTREMRTLTEDQPINSLQEIKDQNDDLIDIATQSYMSTIPAFEGWRPAYRHSLVSPNRDLIHVRIQYSFITSICRFVAPFSAIPMLSLQAPYYRISIDLKNYMNIFSSLYTFPFSSIATIVKLLGMNPILTTPRGGVSPFSTFSLYDSPI